MSKNAMTHDSTPIETKIRAVGDGLGIVFPDEVLQELNIQTDDNILLLKMGEGSYQIVKKNRETQEALETAQRILDRYPHAFRELAK
jgi:antitoxin component of MazEF toxin-antitoxin module